MNFEFIPENKRKFEEYLKRYPQKKAVLLPALWLVQEQQGWISPESMEYLAKLLDLSHAYIYETVTFYTMYNKKPIGKHHIQVCNSVCCWLRGSQETVEQIKKKLNIEVGETTTDKRFHLSTVECLGSCGTAPMMQINNDYYEDLTEAKIDKILKELK
ncbi:MAG: NADH-quinone oxidoreductase subunit E [Deltaproteobacteria bacterium RIFCSPLOWO2_01_44_7]|nr:MAG: NADH-quinone oxidoreductase subunit E [Deltaproteobacteria bacterium RIFCSPHIGHO2_01_FULL_43_49]OGQ14362.1 MAG: NADH-quinone oxidoreductase subunit E [Deltaproteobacteria bacterium RIFCSPHIGHO2_02_FULL_44_53]OGQ27598.1 MAG: NADH-quinone oxidoreductase subunit E [Deltaproteobacteria bacterium RIFCSPHIGHO2_12_FULL_44_21]OGQ30803.1 MAG: NADH-quinone oxidoreductase subunit E [Deltaproteobacteria bacterium RIFCSPLOWO2_01_FULL_45_74]OGQ38826.1 MAG: NADH-quinone oxidoreductase subunit E [Delta